MTGLPDHTFTAADGRSYTLRFSLRAMGLLQSHYGVKSLTEVGARLQDGANMGVDDMVMVLKAGLAAHHRDMSADDVFDLADALGPAGLMAEIQNAMGAASPPTKGSEVEAAARP